MKRTIFLAFLSVLSVAGCSTGDSPGRQGSLVMCGDPSPVSRIETPEPPTPMPPTELSETDRVGYPEGYRETFEQFYVFDRMDVGRVAFVCANDVAAGVGPREPFPYGSILVIEGWRPVRDEDGNLVSDSSGHLIRSELTGVSLMRKEPGFGESYGDKRSGEWEYVGYRPDGTYSTPPEETARCASCHGAGARQERDFVFRTNVHFLPDRYAHSDPVPEAAIGISRMGFQPRTYQVRPGTTVLWQNSMIDETAHAISAGDGSFNSGLLSPGQTFSRTFETPGRYEYICPLHPEQMRGTIEVTNEAG